ncbi:MAG: protein kinase, partial [Gemmatimonadales bacterium]
MPYCPECAAVVPADAVRCPACGSSLVTTPSRADEPAEEQTFDPALLQAELAASLEPQYQLLKLLGLGGMGAVFLAREPALKRLVAVKVLAPWLAADAKARARFEREATAAAQLSHPNVVRVYSVGETTDERLPYIVMQYVQGSTLAEWMEDREKVPERDARRIIGEVAAALAAAHQREFVHRDVKPSNVLLEQESGRAYVADFGVSAALSSEQQLEQTKLTATGMVVGTPVYMSPEQAASEAVTPKSDVYSLGMLAYELITGELPFEASSAMGWVAAHMRDTPTPIQAKRPDLSPEILKLVDRCLAKDAAARPTAAELARGMLPSLETEIEWPPPGLSTLHGAAESLIREVVIAGAGAFLAAMAVASTPTLLRAHPHWLARFQLTQLVSGEDLQLRATPPETGDVVFFTWQILLLVGTVAFVLGLVYVTGHLWRITKLATERRSLGWRWDTLVDVMVDRDGRSGLILAGAREFASLEPERLSEILTARRRRAAAFLAGATMPAGLIGLVAVVTVLGIGIQPTLAPVIPSGLLWVVGGLTLAILSLGVAFHVRERRLLGPLARRRAFAAEAGDVEEWYRALSGKGVGPERPGRPHSLWRRRIGVGLLGVAVFALVVTLIAIAAVSVGAARFVQRMGPATAELLATLDRVSADDPLGTAREVWAPYLPEVEPLDDSTAIGLLRMLATDWESVERLPPYPLERDSLWALPDTATARLRAGTPLGSATFAAAARLGDHPRTRAFRRLAGARPDVFYLAPLDRPMDEYRFWAVPLLRYANLRDGARANALGAIAALQSQDRARAMRRLGENLAVAEHLLRGRTLLSNYVGVLLLQRAVLPQLAA